MEPLTRPSASKVPPSVMISVMVLSPSLLSRTDVASIQLSLITFQNSESVGILSGYVIDMVTVSPLFNPVTSKENSPYGNDTVGELSAVMLDSSTLDKLDSIPELTSNVTSSPEGMVMVCVIFCMVTVT